MYISISGMGKLSSSVVIRNGDHFKQAEILTENCFELNILNAFQEDV